MIEDKPAGTEESKTSETYPKGYGAGYGKRPMWQWVVMYLVLGAIVYGAIYYFYMMPKHNSAGTTTTKSLY